MAASFTIVQTVICGDSWAEVARPVTMAHPWTLGGLVRHVTHSMSKCWTIIIDIVIVVIVIVTAVVIISTMPGG